jgi:RNA polymerase sigma-70 factor (ECF subfamily)
MKIQYEFATGEAVEVEVDDSLGQVIAQIEKLDALQERRETRRHNSLEKLSERKDGEVADPKAVIDDEQIDLYTAIERLTAGQRRLVKEVYFDGLTVREIAERDGVLVQAVYSRLNKIHSRLKKIL